MVLLCNIVQSETSSAFLRLLSTTTKSCSNSVTGKFATHGLTILRHYTLFFSAVNLTALRF